MNKVLEASETALTFLGISSPTLDSFVSLIHIARLILIYKRLINLTTYQNKMRGKKNTNL
jgi:hypothetical protein